MRTFITSWFVIFGILSLVAQIKTNTPDAIGILGQTDFTTKTSGSGASKFNGPNGIAIDPLTGKVFIADRGNHRILRWSSADAMENGSAAEAVLGQPDFETVNSGLSEFKFNNPIGVHIDLQGRLWVGDFSNNRVLRFDNASEKANGAAADGVLGQPDFETNAATIAAEGMRGPVGIFADESGTLWVSEFNSHRVTRYDDAANKENGGKADGVIGQADFESGSSGLAINRLANPNSVFVDKDGRLWISENGNRRVLRFDDAKNKADGADADGVLGQPDFDTNTSQLTRNGFTVLRFVAGDDNGRIYVIQENSHRIAVFENAAALANGADADYIWGQVDFTSNANPDPPTAASYNTPRAMFVNNANGDVWVTDWANHRVLRYSSRTDYPPIVIQNQQAATGVLGQTDFVSKTSGSGANKFNGPNGVAVDPTTGKIFVADRGNHRVLRWTSEAAMTNGSDAEAVLGQPDFSTVNSGLAADKMNNPIGVHVDKEGRLYVGDFSNNRVLRFDNASNIPSGTAADGVLGQPDFSTSAAVISATGMRGPVGIWADHEGRLWVSEFNNHRVTRYDDAANKPNGAAADGVIGQADFDSGTSGLGPDRLGNPNSVFVDLNGTLWTSENANRRVLRFDDAANKANGATADGVLGQPDFVTNTSNLTQDGFTTLRFVAGDHEGRIYVMQENSHRIAIFENAATLPNGAPADFIWGQADFISNTNPDPPTATSYNVPRAIYVDNNTGIIWVADWSNHRVLRYGNASGGFPSLVVRNTPSADVVLGQTDFVSKSAGAGANKFNGPNGVAVDPTTGKIFVADRGNHRVLRWTNEAAMTNGSDAEAVLGQPDFETVNSGLASDKMNNPIGVHVDNDGNLYVGDFSNNRVLRFDNASNIPSGTAADGVLGQPDFTTGAAVISATGMRGPVGIWADHEGRLWVSEFNNHRVTRYDDAANKPNGADADGVIGQADFDSGTSGLGPDRLGNPNSVFVDLNGTLWTSENANRRVLRFDDAANKANGASADGVLGQPDFVTNTSNLTQDGFTTLRFVAGDHEGRIYVMQENSHRIAIFENAAALANGAPADYIWGQSDFVSNTNPDPPTASSYNVPRAIYVDNNTGNVWVADWSNHRVLRYGLAASDQKTLALVAPAAGASWMQNTTQNIQWTSNLIESLIIEFTGDDGMTWDTIATVVASESQFAWTVNATETTEARIRLTDSEDPEITVTSELFSIIPTIFDLTLISPNGYQEWEIGTGKRILFQAINVAQVSIELSLDAGGSWEEIAIVDAASGVYNWTPTETSEQALIRITDVSNPLITVESANTFKLVPEVEDIQDFIFYEDSPTPVFYDFSFGFANAPSTLERVNNVKFPVSTDYSFRGTYGLVLDWFSAPGGDWGMAAAGQGWPGRDLSNKDTLSFRMFTETAVSTASMPVIYLEDLSNQKTGKFKLSNYQDRLEPNTWNHIKIPLQDFVDAPGAADMTRIKTIFFGQDQADATPHRVYIDDMRAYGGRVISGDSGVVFVVLGSSTSAGIGASTADSSWVGRFRNHVQSLDSNAIVINLGVGGYTTYDIMPAGFVPPAGRPSPKINNNITYALSFKPTAIIVNMPSNDANLNFTIEEQISNFNLLAGLAEQDSVEFWVTTTQPRNFADDARRQSLMIMRDSLLSIFGEKGVNIFDEMAQPDGRIKTLYDSGDGIHVNNAGHKYIYDQIVGAGILDSISTGISPEIDKGTGWMLYPAFPNPFREFTQIKYELTHGAEVVLTIRDALGRVVMSWNPGWQGAGVYQYTWESGMQSPGLYFASLYSKDHHNVLLTQKMLLMR